jgi:hypothetical protein
MSIAIDRALCDPQLLGAALGDVSTWRTWPAILRAAFALPMDDEDRALFAAVSGGRADPVARVSELWCIAGRRSGKSRMAAAVAAFVGTCIDHRPRLAPRSP